MIKLILLLCVSVSVSSYGQLNQQTNIKLTGPQDSTIYIKKCIAFINEIKNEQLADTNFILVSNPFSFEYNNCISTLLMDSSTFSNDELTFIKEKQYPKLTKWTKELFTTIKIISQDTLNSIFKDNSKGWNLFHKNIGQSFNSFSIPIFLRNDTYCLFYTDNHCGGECGDGRLILYKKERNKWTEVKSYCNWIS
jgi:hypothetical protein